MNYLFDIKDKIIKNIDNDNILDKLYFLTMRPPTIDEIKKSKIFKDQDPTEIKKKIKSTMSRLENKVPLYDPITENIYLINRENVYSRVVYQNYRFPDKEIIDDLKKNRDILQKEIEDKNITDKFIIRKLRKYKLMIKFMSYFYNKTLYDTYIRIFYKYSELLGKKITTCKNPSFIPQFNHIKPYLTKGEIINTALNIGADQNLDISELCRIVRENQITSKILLDHQKHIIENQKLGLVQYYTLQGSYFMNQYLRDMTEYKYKNEFLEKIIEPMWQLVLDSPTFDKEYIVYRFVKEDTYLSNLDIGDIFTEKGFMSTTRDPFYRSDLYKFGFILIKIRIPKNIKGIALCLETVSHFPEEQEIIFSPNTKFKLISKDSDCVYFHTDESFSSKIKTKYEFEWIGNDGISFDRTKTLDKISTIDFLGIEKQEAKTLEEKIKSFESKYVNELYQFKVKIGNLELVVFSEWYNSIGAYKDFYAIETKTGYSIYTMYEGYVLFFIEIGNTDIGTEMHVNYYVKYSSIDPNKIVGDENLIKFFSSIAYYYDISNIFIYANYLNCDIGGNKKTIKTQRSFSHEGHEENSQIYNPNPQIYRGSYCLDLYQYMSTGVKRYSDINVLNVELYPKFSYYDLDMLKKVSPKTILAKEDRDEVYQLYDKSFKQSKKQDTIYEYYIWLKENKCYVLDIFLEKLDRISGYSNPFKNDIYILDAYTYLYNRKYIRTYPKNSNINVNTLKRNILSTNKNNNRD